MWLLGLFFEREREREAIIRGWTLTLSIGAIMISWTNQIGRQ